MYSNGQWIAERARVRAILYVINLPSARMRCEGYCSWVCLSVCPLLNVSLLECLFVPETIPSTQRTMKVRIGGVLSENSPLQTYSIVWHAGSRHFIAAENAHALYLAQAYLGRTGSACSVYLEGTRNHNEWRVSTLACYLLL